ncbi:hypothetical protein LUZ60_005798 [Juncus effusus]|nr:hypothetical protein LUZ60_005798 [Juncus effusus]
MATRTRTTRLSVPMGPDWSNLPTDVVELISEKIVFKEQYEHLRLVCRHWTRACPPHPCHLIGQVPWLWLTPELSSSTLCFYNLAQSKLYNIDLADVIHKIPTTSSRGWILLENDTELSLFNPITREMKSNCLPSLAAPPTILAFARNQNTIDPSHFDLHQSTPHSCKVILTSSPSHEGCIAVAWFYSLWELGFCRVGDKSWTILKLWEDGLGSCEISDFVHKNGLVYAMKDRGQIIVYDLENLSQKTQLSYACFLDSLYLAMGVGEFDGVPLVVRRVHGTLKDEFEVYRCSNERARSRWRRVRNIGNAVLLLGNRQCEMVPIDSIQSDGLEGNHICYCPSKFSISCFDFSIKIKMISIENWSIKEVLMLSSPGSGYLSLFTPSLC